MSRRPPRRPRTAAPPPALHVVVDDLDPDELAALLDHVRATGRCRCGGPAQLTDPPPGCAVRLTIEHMPGCAVGGGTDMPATFLPTR